jgi:2-furoyl-CoA dehydrogenase large subunit
MGYVTKVLTLEERAQAGAKGVGEGNSMSTPVCLANAAADALGVADLALPLTRSRVAALLPSASP